MWGRGDENSGGGANEEEEEGGDKACGSEKVWAEGEHSPLLPKPPFTQTFLL